MSKKGRASRPPGAKQSSRPPATASGASRAAKPASEAAKPASEAAKPASEAAKPASEAAKPASEAAKPDASAGLHDDGHDSRDSHDSIGEAFFSEGTRKSSLPPPPIEDDPEDDRRVRLHEDPEVLARRARSQRMVRGFLLALGALFLVATARRLLEEPAPASAPTSPAVTQAAVVVNAPPAPSAAVSAVATVATTEPSASAPEAGPADAASTDAQALSAPPDAAVVAPEKDAKTHKRDAQRALDRGKFADAIESAKASVAADPTDAEAWLLLGAAYDSKGRPADARRAYQSCVSEGKRGPKGECAALLR